MISGMNIMNIVEFSGIYVGLNPIISENKKMINICEIKNTDSLKKITPSSLTTTQTCDLKYACIIYLIINPNIYV